MHLELSDKRTLKINSQLDFGVFSGLTYASALLPVAAGLLSLSHFTFPLKQVDFSHDFKLSLLDPKCEFLTVTK